MKVCVISASLGGYDREWPWAEQIAPDGVEVEIHRLNDSNFPPRSKAMMPALQCGIPKWFAHDLFPGFDRYMWVDASCALTSGNEVRQWLTILGDHDIALFNHPERKAIAEEYEFIRQKMSEGNRYLTSRYNSEWLDEQYQFITSEGQPYAPLYASTAFIYDPTRSIKEAFKEVAFQKFRYHLHDQLALAYALQKYDIDVRAIDGNYQKSELLEFVRNKK